jgi:uncharacterized protein YkwD
MRLKNIRFGNKDYWNKVFLGIGKIFLIALILSLAVFVVQTTYLVGYSQGKIDEHTQIFRSIIAKTEPFARTSPQPTTTPSPTKNQPTPTQKAIPNNNSYGYKVNWGGPELWEAVNTRRKELGVNALNKRDELCTIASIRVNDLLELGKLDGHAGFGTLQERSDLGWIFKEFGTVAEFLAVGGKTPEETVALWEHSLGHKILLTGGEFVWGCIYAQNTFAVAIAAY